MRAWLFAWVLLEAAAGTVLGQEALPYRAYVAVEEVDVHGGPSTEHAPTAKLPRGTIVEVYRHHQGDWRGVRPPAGSFSWIETRFLRLGQDGLAEVTADRTPAYVGSRFSNARDVVQVHLDAGELVEIIADDDTAWHKIAPVAGEFRWISGEGLVAIEQRPEDRHAGVTTAAHHEQPSSRSEAVIPAVATEPIGETSPNPRLLPSPTWTAAPPIALPPVARPKSARPVEPIATMSRRVPGQATTRSPAPLAAFLPDIAPRASDTSSAARSERPIIETDFPTARDLLDADLAVLLVEEPSVWQVDALRARADQLLGRARTPLERGQAGRLVDRIARVSELKVRHDVVTDVLRSIHRSDPTGSSAPNVVETPTPQPSGFDGMGRLTRVHSEKLDAPRFALVDDRGELQCLVTPAPGVKLDHYLNHRVGITGSRGYLSTKDAPHVMAKRVTPLGSRYR